MTWTTPKPCIHCGGPKPKGEGRRSCDACLVESRRRSNRRQRTNRKGNDLRHRYGISHDTYLATLEAQDHACAMCGAVPDHTLCVDHDHTTGAPRALLCRRCNVGLGYLEDPDWLRRATAYLANPPRMETTTMTIKSPAEVSA